MKINCVLEIKSSNTLAQDLFSAIRHVSRGDNLQITVVLR